MCTSDDGGVPPAASEAKPSLFPSIHWKCSAAAVSLRMPQGLEVKPELLAWSGGLSHNSLLHPAWALTPSAGIFLTDFVEYSPYICRAATATARETP